MLPRASRNLELKPTADGTAELQELDHEEASVTSASQNYQGYPSESDRRYYHAYGEGTSSMTSSIMSTSARSIDSGTIDIHFISITT